MSLINSRY